MISPLYVIIIVEKIEEIKNQALIKSTGISKKSKK